MKVIRFIKTLIISSIFIGLFLLVFATMAASFISQRYGVENRFLNILTEHVSIQSIMTEDYWSQKYPYEDEVSYLEKYVKKVENVEQIVESYCTVSLPGSEIINNAVSGFKQQIYHYRVDEIKNTYENTIYVQEAAQNVVEFSKELNSEGYSFLYVQTPQSGSISYYREQAENFSLESLSTVERSRAFTDILEKSGINVINIAKDYDNNISFDPSGHWFPENALYCSGIIAQELNERYNFEFNLTDYEKTSYYDLLDEYPEQVKLIEQNCGYKFGLPIPLKQYDFKWVHAEKDVLEGNFNDVMITEPREWNVEGGAYHEMLNFSNSLMYDITNYSTDTNIGKSILIIGDSFNWPVSMYLSVGIERITFVHNASFTGSMLSYVKSLDPDIVIMVYNDAEFYDIYTKDAYYLK